MQNFTTTTRTAKLIMVTALNNNKFYEMSDSGNGFFSVSYGRVGQQPSVVEYDIHLWESKYREKIRKGYKDVTHLFSAQHDKTDSWAAIEEHTVRELFHKLTSYAKKSVQYHYHISPDEVTVIQLEEAQYLLNLLSDKIQVQTSVEEFNELLLALYQIIPRRMEHVRKYLIDKIDIGHMQKLIASEQETLDVMRSEVEIGEAQKKTTQNQKTQTLLEAIGIEVTTLEEDNTIDFIEIKRIKKMMQEEVGKFVKAYRVKDISQEKYFTKHLKQSKYRNTELLWHGSRNENWLSILKTGLVLRPTTAVINGKMFGYGLYFADRCRKSINYTSLYGSYWTGGNQNRAFLAIYEVHTGKQLKIKQHHSWCYTLTLDNLRQQAKEADSLFAEGGVDLLNNEYIVYQEEQCTIRYLVEIQY